MGLLSAVLFGIEDFKRVAITYFTQSLPHRLCEMGMPGTSQITGVAPGMVTRSWIYAHSARVRGGAVD